ncbi:MAG: NAD(P)-dependent oxidoreductase [Deltaproteobacteria bacterium]|nr:NAD(P)-dependent oxidoreductase [Deltaproteobacteria bacterium]
MKLGWIGTGVMGASMAGHLQRGGHALAVFNRTREKSEPLLDEGAIWCDSPAGVAEKSDIVFTIVGHPEDVEEVYLGDKGVFAARNPADIVVDMTTSRPALAKTIAEAAEKRGIDSLDAPVSGGDVGAREGTLAIMVGGKKSVYDKILPLFELMGTTLAYMGDAGSGQHTKVSNQILVAGNMIGACESLLYAHKQGLDMQAVIDIIGKGAAGSWSINNLGPRIAKGNFDPGFFVEHFIKDMGIALEECRAIGLSLPGLALVQQLYIAVKAQGHGRLGTQSLFLGLQTLNGDTSS